MDKVGPSSGGQDRPESVTDTQQEVSQYPWSPWNTRHIETESGREQYHCVPLDDKKPHIYSVLCGCDPELAGQRETFYGGRSIPLFMHNSFDMREIDEWWYFTIQHPDEGNSPA